MNVADLFCDECGSKRLSFVYSGEKTGLTHVTCGECGEQWEDHYSEIWSAFSE